MNIYKKIQKNIHRLEIDNPDNHNKKLKWTNVINPGKQELEYLRKNYKFDLACLQASSAKITAQRPMVIQQNGYVFLILHFPILEDGNITPSELDIFIGENFLISLHKNIKSINDYFYFSRKDGRSLLSYQMESPAALLYELLDRLMGDTFGLLDKNSLAISEVENMIFAESQKEAVSKILVVRRNFINIRKIMQSHKNIIKKLMAIETKLVNDELRSYYKRLLENSKTIWEILENQKEMIEALNNTNEALLNYKISDIMKTLTIFSVIVFPLTLFAAIFGMNTTGGMPFVESGFGFWIIIIMMSVGCLLMLLLFERKKWL